MPYLGNEPTFNFASVTKDSFSGDGSTTAFTLSKAATTNGVAVFVENVRQEPTTAYAVSGTTLTFTAAPVSSSGNNIYVLHHNAPASTAIHSAAQPLTATSGTFTGDVSIDGGSFVFNESSADKDFRVESNDHANMFFVDGGNNRIGIGTASADGGVHIKGVSDHGRIILESGGTSGSNNGTFMQFHNHGGTEIAQIAVDEGATDQGQMIFKTGGTDESMRITHDHKVGIGVTSPGSLFNIASSGGFMGIERFLGGDAAGPGIAFYKSRGSSQNSKTVVAENDVLGQIAVYGADGSTWVPGGYMRWMVNDTPGSSDMPCGIEFGTTNNGQAVAGIAGVLNQVNAKFPGATTSTGNSANCQVDGNGRLHTSTSSKIYKTAIEDLEDEYADKIFSLEPKFYKSNPETVGDDTTKIKPDWSYYGLLAEDVEKIEPRLVTYKLTEEKQVDSGSKGEQGETMYKTVTSNLDTPVPMNVNYDRITAHLINVVKRFKTRIEELETSNADLVKRVEALESA